MKKALLLKIINPVLVVLLMTQAATVVSMKVGFALDLIFPIHGLVGYGLVLIGLIHLGLNWNWVKTNFLPKKHRAPSN